MIIAPSAEANKESIALALAEHAPFSSASRRNPATCLEIGSGTGQHAALLARRFPHVQFLPSEVSGGCSGPQAAPHDIETVFASIFAHTTKISNVLAPIELNAADDDWPVSPSSFDCIFCSKVLHIAPWSATLGLLRGARRVLKPGGRLFLYGTFTTKGKHISERNAGFDARLKANNSSWGVRDATDIAAQAAFHGLRLDTHQEMPDDDALLVFGRRD